MSGLSWNWYWGSSTTWESYLRNRDIVAAINGGRRSSAEYLNSCMSSGAREIVGSIDSLGQLLSANTQNMAEGFDALERAGEARTREIVGAINVLEESVALGNEQVVGAIEKLGRELSALFNWGFTEMLASIGHMGDTLDALVKAAKTPAQTAAYEQFEIARDAYRRGLYVEALESLQCAIFGAQGITTGYKLEWRFHYLEGLIYLGSHSQDDKDLVDPDRAEQSFLRAARYARKDFPFDAAKSMLSAGWAAFTQGSYDKLREALAHTEDSIVLDPNLGEALFQKAKLHMALDDPDAGLRALREAIAFSGLFGVKASADGDFRKHEGRVLELLDSIRQEKAQKVSEHAKPLSSKIRNLMSENAVFSAHEIPQRFVALAEHPDAFTLLELTELLTVGLARDVEKLKAMRFSVVRRSFEEWDEEIAEEVPTGETREVDEKILERPGRLFGMIPPLYRTERRSVSVTKPVKKVIRRRGSEKNEKLVVDGLGDVVRVLQSNYRI